ncbi:hypothetical protein O3G_MSEX009988 [Manduca sexta]|uniref:Insulin-like domain-containing protein n=1 Tax=Manduca sexta TaxID=7130 RepID=A0A922CSM7_MANSE|nr:hypothetical protein O3G_MSEX009988 [Manduca sexta]KAG6456874.1 hypothetical protein O3G_MSEX009988 [Manduca sexta]
MKLLTAVVMLWSLCAMVHAAGERQYCGRTLANARELLCSNYNLVKRSSMEGEDWWWDRAMLKSTRGKRNGIVEECCYKPCSVDELLTYC